MKPQLITGGRVIDPSRNLDEQPAITVVLDNVDAGLGPRRGIDEEDTLQEIGPVENLANRSWLAISLGPYGDLLLMIA